MTYHYRNTKTGRVISRETPLAPRYAPWVPHDPTPSPDEPAALDEPELQSGAPVEVTLQAGDAGLPFVPAPAAPAITDAPPPAKVRAPAKRTPRKKTAK